MNIKEILGKIAKGEKLSAEEIDFVAKWEVPDDNGRIPKDRLDKEIEKRKAAESEQARLESELATLKDKIDELETNGMDEAQKAKLASEREIAKLKKQVDTLTAANEEAKQKAATLERTAKVRELATSKKFRDSDYLDYKLKSSEIDLDNQEAIQKFFGDLEKSNPELFESNAKPGTGTTGGNPNQNNVNAVNLARLDELRKKPDFTNAEAAEFIKLSESINNAETGENN